MILGQEKYKMSLKHLVVPESKDLLKKKKIKERNYFDGVMSKGHRNQLNKVPMAKARVT